MARICYQEERRSRAKGRGGSSWSCPAAMLLLLPLLLSANGLRTGCWTSTVVSSVEPYNATHLNILFDEHFPNCAAGEVEKIIVEDKAGKGFPDEDVSYDPETGSVLVKVGPCEEQTLTLQLVLRERNNATSEAGGTKVRYNYDLGDLAECTSQEPSSPEMWVLVALVAALMAALLVVAYIKRPTEIDWTQDPEEAKLNRRKPSDPVHTTQNPYAKVDDQFKDGWRDDHVEIRPEKLETYIAGPDSPPAQYVEDKSIMFC